ncbi:MAG TPA: M48 family metalloprotease [Rhodanobacteraceae bacterium]|nr:M48 family metalloprotease [Rhodanobacteraceae bacterium]
MMDFFARQDQVRRHGFWLMLAFALAVLMLVVAVDLVAAWLYHVWHAFKPPLHASMGAAGYIKTSLATLLVIGGAAAWRIHGLRGGGASMAESMGATQVPMDTDKPAWRILRNVVEEIAIASSVPVPDVFVMEDELCINAFTVGHTPSDAAICVTGGCLDLLDRDELQGLVAHEFSHVLHGDMRLNIHMIGLLFGIHGIGVLGKYMMVTSLPGFIAGVPIIVVGSLGSLFARGVQAAIARSRSALADAAALQFTRQARGIVGALKKIQAFQHGSMLMVYNRAEIAHMTFGDPTGAWLLKTHPSLPARVRALGMVWSDAEIRLMHDRWREWKGVTGRPPEPATSHASAGWHHLATAAAAAVAAGADLQTVSHVLPGSRAMRVSAMSEPALATGMDDGAEVDAPPANVVFADATRTVAETTSTTKTPVSAKIGRPESADIDKAAQLRDDMPSALRRAVQNPMLAAGAILALVLDDKEELRKHQIAHVEQMLGKEAAFSVENMHRMLTRLSPLQRLPLAQLAFPCLRRNSSLDIRRLMMTLAHLVRMDRNVDVHEYCLQHMLHAQLDDLTRPRRRMPRARKRLDQCRGAVATLCAIVANQAGDGDEAAVQQAYRQALAYAFPGWQHDFLLPVDWQGTLDSVLIGLSGLVGEDKQRLVDCLARAAQADGVIRVEEAELLRVICASLGCPLPLLGIEPQDAA